MLPLLLAGAALGGLGSYMGAQGASSSARKAMRGIQSASQVQPMMTGFGSVSRGPDGQMITSLSGPYAQMRGMLQGQMGARDVSLSPEMQAMRGSMYGMAGDYMGMAQPGEMYGRESFQLGMPTTDIGQTAKDQMALMQELVAPQRAKEAGSAEAGLFARGMLGSSAGAAHMGQLEQANRMQDVAMAQQALGEARATRGQELQEAQAAMQSQMAGAGMGMQQQQQLFGQGMMGLEAGMGMDQFYNQLQQQEQQRQYQAMQGMMGMAGLEGNLANMSQQRTQQLLQAQGMMGQFQQQANQNPFAAMMGGMGGGLMNAGMMGMMRPAPQYNATPSGQYGPMAGGYQY